MPKNDGAQTGGGTTTTTAAAGDTGTQGAGGGAEDRSQWVPPGRLREVSGKLSEALAEVARLAPLAASAEKLQTEYTSAKATWADERAGLAVGLDDEGISVARHLYGGLAGEKPAFGEWIAKQKAAPTFKALNPWFAAQQQTQTLVTPANPIVPAQKAAVLQAPGGEGGKSHDQIIADAVRTGNWDEYNKIRGNLIKPPRP